MADMNPEVAISESKSDENDGIEASNLVEELAEDYVKYLEVDVNKEKVYLDESIEEMLTRLDEFCGLVDLIRSDTSLCIHETIPKIQAKSMQLEPIFRKIDKLEEFIEVVKRDLAVLEEQVNKAEDEMGSFSSIKKMFTSFPSFMKKQPPVTQKPEPKLKYEPPPIFNSDDFFGPQPQKTRAKSESETRFRAPSAPQVKSRSQSEAAKSSGGIVELAKEAEADET